MNKNEDLTSELYEALKETMQKFKKVYGISGYYQSSEYAAINNGTDNWFLKSKKAIEKYERINNIISTK